MNRQILQPDPKSQSALPQAFEQHFNGLENGNAAKSRNGKFLSEEPFPGAVRRRPEFQHLAHPACVSE